MIKLDLWDIINAKPSNPRDDIPESLEKPEDTVGEQVEAEDAEGHGNDPTARAPECGDRSSLS